MGGAQSSGSGGSVRAAKTLDERIADLRQTLWEDAQGHAPVKIALLGDVGSGKTTAKNTATRISTQRYDETGGETGSGAGRTTVRVRSTPLRVKPADGGAPAHAFTVIDFPGCPLVTQLNHEFLNAALQGVRAGTGAENPDDMVQRILDPANQDVANAPDYCVFVIDPIAIQRDRALISRVFFGNPGVDNSGVDDLTEGARRACVYGSPMVLITKKQHPDRHSYTTTETVRQAFRSCFPASNFFDAEGYTEPGIMIKDTELEYLRMLRDIQLRVLEQ